MTFKDVLKAKIEHDLGFDFYTRQGGAPKTFAVKAKEPGMLCGGIFIMTIIRLVEEGFFLDDDAPGDNVKITHRMEDGSRIASGDIIAELRGDGEGLLKAERMICDILSELSGIATHTAEKVAAMGGVSVTLLDTRKGDPLMRSMWKYAVRVGGGMPHRAGFFDGVLIKDNDIAVLGGVVSAIEGRTREAKHLTRVAIEVGDEETLKQVLSDGRADTILLDNMAPENLREAVSRIKASGRGYRIEASGVGERALSEIAATGVGYISLSALTRGAPHLDISMKAES